MDPTITSLIVGAILTALGWMGKAFLTSLKEARAGKKEAADKVRISRDKYHRLFLQWRDHAYLIRGRAHQAGVNDLPPTPPDEHQNPR